MKVLLLFVLVFFLPLLLAAPDICSAPTQCMTTEGASCSATKECDNSMYCDSSKKCRNRIPLGGSCSTDTNAAPCVQTPSRQSPSVGCVNGICAFTGRIKGASCKKASECREGQCINGACDGRKLGESCPGSLSCGKGLYCNQTSRGVGSMTCIPRRLQGESCWIGAIDACAEGLLCVNNNTKNEVLSVCLPYGSRPVGGICGEAYACEPGLYCTGGVNSPGRCAQVTYVPTNATCDPYDNNYCDKNPQAQCVCTDDYPKSVCTGPQTYTPEQISDFSYFRLCAVNKPDCYGNWYKCDCDPQYLWDWANRKAKESKTGCNKLLYDFVSEGPPSSTTARPTASPTPRPTSGPTSAPTPTLAPTLGPTLTPTLAPTRAPTLAPTRAPTLAPTRSPTLAPTPTRAPTSSPTIIPIPTPTPTLAPTHGTTAPATLGSPTGSSSGTSASSATTASAPTTSSPTSAPTTSAPTASTIDVGQSSGSMVVASVISALLVSLVCLA